MATTYDKRKVMTDQRVLSIKAITIIHDLLTRLKYILKTNSGITPDYEGACPTTNHRKNENIYPNRIASIFIYSAMQPSQSRCRW